MLSLHEAEVVGFKEAAFDAAIEHHDPMLPAGVSAAKGRARRDLMDAWWTLAVAHNPRLAEMAGIDEVEEPAFEVALASQNLRPFEHHTMDELRISHERIDCVRFLRPSSSLRDAAVRCASIRIARLKNKSPPKICAYQTEGAELVRRHLPSDRPNIEELEVARSAIKALSSTRPVNAPRPGECAAAVAGGDASFRSYLKRWD